MNGKVYLMGAGPGDPELLTVKAMRALRSAEIVLHDDLVSAEILALVSADAYLENVGKRCGEKRISQQQINQQIVGYARAGFTVVRVKGGDPLIFGRAGEEMQALRAAKIPFEIIPGITAASAAAAAAQVPLTDRSLNSSLIFVTAHRCGGNRADNWRAIVSTGSTIAVYMPGKDYGALAEELIAAGLDSETPCLIASRIATEKQQFWQGVVHQLREAALPAPSLILVGSVAELRNHDAMQANLYPEFMELIQNG